MSASGWKTLAIKNNLKGFYYQLEKGNEAFIRFMEAKIKEGEITLWQT